MSSISWIHPELVHLLWLVAGFCAVLVVLELRAGAALAGFVSRSMQARLAASASRGQRLLRVGAIGACLTAGVLGLMRPQGCGNRDTGGTGRVSADLMIVLDVSRSMLAEDAAPNRLARARAEISSMLDKLPNHRVGLIAFAGKAAIMSPLTPDYAFFRMILRGADPNSVSRGGTAIGEALRLAVAAFDDETADSARLILLITDGEDHGSYPEEAATAAKDSGIRVVAVGLGSEEGAEILITDRKTGAKKPVLDSGGQPVLSRVDGVLLARIADLTGGVYVPAGTAALDLESIVDEHIAPIIRDSTPAAVRAVPTELYPWFVLVAMGFLILASVVGAPARRGGRP